jgi:hypothetical protein
MMVVQLFSCLIIGWLISFCLLPRLGPRSVLICFRGDLTRGELFSLAAWPPGLAVDVPCLLGVCIFGGLGCFCNILYFENPN